MDPWNNPDYYFEREYYYLPVSYYRNLNLRFGGYPEPGTEEFDVRYVDMVALRSATPVECYKALYVPVRFRVRVPGSCPNAGFDDCYCGFAHPEHTGEAIVDIPLRLLRKFSEEQGTVLPPRLMEPTS